MLLYIVFYYNAIRYNTIMSSFESNQANIIIDTEELEHRRDIINDAFETIFNEMIEKQADKAKMEQTLAHIKKSINDICEIRKVVPPTDIQNATNKTVAGILEKTPERAIEMMEFLVSVDKRDEEQFLDKIRKQIGYKQNKCDYIHYDNKISFTV